MTSASTPVAKFCSGTMATQRYYQTDALVLASASPRRAELLDDCRLHLRRAAGRRRRDAARLPNRPTTYALRVARDKARGCRRVGPRDSARLRSWRPIPSSSRDGRILGKPADHADAREMLTTAVGRGPRGAYRASSYARRRRSPRGGHDARTLRRAQPRPRSTGMCRRGEPDGKAGAYAIQGRARGSSTGSRARGRTWSGCRSRRSTGCSAARACYPDGKSSKARDL